jgi:hypothetical protein
VIRTSSGLFDIVLQGGRVIDPETGLDAKRSIGIRGDKIAVITREPLDGKLIIEADSSVVSPGWIDVCDGVQSLECEWDQASDGVTTILETEPDGIPVCRWYDHQALYGRALNYGLLEGSAYSLFCRHAPGPWNLTASNVDAGSKAFDNDQITHIQARLREEHSSYINAGLPGWKSDAARSVKLRRRSRLGQLARSFVRPDPDSPPGAFIEKMRFPSFIEKWVSLGGHLSLREAIDCCSFSVAKIFEPDYPKMGNKGRLQVGADADVVVFSLDQMPEQPGMLMSDDRNLRVQHVIVNGTLLIRDEELDVIALPGRPILSMRM